MPVLFKFKLNGFDKKQKLLQMQSCLSEVIF